MGSLVSTCSCCGRDFRVSFLKAGMCRECSREYEPTYTRRDIEDYEDVSSPAEDSEAAYNGGEFEADYDNGLDFD